MNSRSHRNHENGRLLNRLSVVRLIFIQLADKPVGHVFNVPIFRHVENVPHRFVR